MAKYQVIETRKGIERIVATTRREQGAENERDIAVDSSYQNARRHAERTHGRAVQGPDGKGGIIVVQLDGASHIEASWTYSVRRVGREPDVDLTDTLLASLLAVSGTTR